MNKVTFVAINTEVPSQNIEGTMDDIVVITYAKGPADELRQELQDSGLKMATLATYMCFTQDPQDVLEMIAVRLGREKMLKYPINDERYPAIATHHLGTAWGLATEVIKDINIEMTKMEKL
jgi:hypothetical protein